MAICGKLPTWIKARSSKDKVGQPPPSFVMDELSERLEPIFIE